MKKFITLFLASFIIHFYINPNSADIKLIIALKQNDLENVKKAITEGADINFVDPISGQTPLDIALDNFKKYSNLKPTQREKNIYLTILSTATAILLGETAYASKTGKVPLYIENRTINLMKKLNENEKKHFVKSRFAAGIASGILTIVAAFLIRKLNRQANQSAEILKILISNPLMKISEKKRKLLSSKQIELPEIQYNETSIKCN